MRPSPRAQPQCRRLSRMTSSRAQARARVMSCAHVLHVAHCHTAATSAPGPGSPPATSAPGPGSPHPHLLHRNWNHPCHVCIATGLTPATVCACMCACVRACVWGARGEVHCRAECQRDVRVSSQCPRTTEELKSRRPPQHCTPPAEKHRRWDSHSTSNFVARHSTETRGACGCTAHIQWPA
jgi:hypothetical protein